MHLWEFNLCVNAYNEKITREQKSKITVAYYTAVFSSHAFSGKLKPVEHYLKNNKKEVAQVKGFTTEECKKLEKKEWRQTQL